MESQPDSLILSPIPLDVAMPKRNMLHHVVGEGDQKMNEVYRYVKTLPLRNPWGRRWISCFGGIRMEKGWRSFQERGWGLECCQIHPSHLLFAPCPSPRTPFHALPVIHSLPQVYLLQSRLLAAALGCCHHSWWRQLQAGCWPHPVSAAIIRLLLTTARPCSMVISWGIGWGHKLGDRMGL